jgi:predicted lipoprotein with Yx(FWY)xxD motif
MSRLGEITVSSPRRGRGFAPALAVLGVTGLALVAAACGGSSGSGGGGNSIVAVKTKHNSTLGNYLVDRKGFTVYWTTKDRSSKLACKGRCTAYWPPLTVPSGKTPSGASDLGTRKRSNGVLQVTWKGHPLYRFSGDSAPGQTNGEGLSDSWGTWYAGGTSSAKGSTSTSSSGYGGY